MGNKNHVDDDGYFKSIKVTSLLSDKEPWILASSATKVFYLPDPKKGTDWNVVQEYTNRHKFDGEEAYQEQEQQAAGLRENQGTYDVPPRRDEEPLTTLIDDVVVNALPEQKEDEDNVEEEIDETDQ